MAIRSKLDRNRLRFIEPGKRVWEDGVGYWRNKNGDGGAWYIRYRAPVVSAPSDGSRVPTKQISERLPNCENRTQARRVLEDRRASIFKATYRPAADRLRVRLDEFAVEFLKEKRHLRSVSKYEQQLRQHILPFFGSAPLNAISKRDCRAYYAARLDAGAAIATANSEIACLKSLFSAAIDAELCEQNPAKGVKLLPPNNGRDRILTRYETARLFKAADSFDDYVRPTFYTLYFTGMRLDEMLSLRWSDIEWDRDQIVVRFSKSGEGRKIPIPPRLKAELRRWRPFTGRSDWVFPNPSSPSKRIKTVRKGWLRLCEKAEVENLVRHDLRHNFVSLLQANGVSDSIIMNITGHKTTAMLYRYSHADDEARHAAVNALDRPVNMADIVSLRKVENETSK